MTPERWAQIEELFHRAAESAPELRIQLLDEGCNGDSGLRREVEVLLGSEECACHRMQAAVDGGLDAMTFPLVGHTLSHYQILDGLGGGGMGLVYRAEDIKLGRQVALKFLPEESARNPEALARFEREARSASALEHPNICPIYEFGEHDGQPFLVLQLLEGQTLQELISAAGEGKSPLELSSLLDLAIQITDGLDAAHHQGIIHRDIKPANIFVTSKGQAKILDFGLAKLAAARTVIGADSGQNPRDGRETEGVPGETASMPTQDPFLSLTGAAMGTAGYMSPEQARGENLDGRTDLFSFGLVLNEMATGQCAFEGGSGPVLHHAMLTQTSARVRQLSPELPAKLGQIITKMLEKDRASRYQTASKLRADLESLRRDLESKKSLRRMIPAGVTQYAVLAVSVALLTVTFALNYFRPFSRSPNGPTKITQVSQWNKPMNEAKLSPDGHTVAFASPVGGTSQVFLMPTSGGEPLQLTNDEGDKVVHNFSPDGKEVYYGRYLGPREVWTVPTLGGRPHRVAATRYMLPALDNASFFYTKGDNPGIFRARKSGLNEELVFDAEGIGWFFSPTLLFPGGNDLLAAGVRTGSPNVVIYRINLTSHEAINLGEVSANLGNPGFVWAEPGNSILFSRIVNGLTNIWEYNLTDRSLKQITFGTGPDFSPMPDPAGKGIYYVNGKSSGSLIAYRVHSNESTEIVSEDATQPVISPDGKRLMYVTLVSGRRHAIWVSDIDGVNKVKIATGEGLSTGRWAPDSFHLSFTEAGASGGSEVYIIAADGGGLRQLPPIGSANPDSAWSADQKSVYVSSAGLRGPRTTIWQWNVAGSNLEKFIDKCCIVFDADPSGKYLLGVELVGEETGIYEVSVSERKSISLLPDVITFGATFARDGKSFLYAVPSRSEVTIYRQPWSDGKLIGAQQVALKVPFAFPVDYHGSAYDFSRDLSTIVYARPSTHADLYLLSSN